MSFRVDVVDPDEPDVAALLTRHFAIMRAQTPPESCHVLPGDALKSPDVTVFAVREADKLLAVGALRVAGQEGEVKSMHTAQVARGRGAGQSVLKAITEHARNHGLKRLNLETGSGSDHAAARRLYQRAGFVECPPFGSYTSDPLSHFMTLAL